MCLNGQTNVCASSSGKTYVVESAASETSGKWSKITGTFNSVFKSVSTHKHTYNHLRIAYSVSIRKAYNEFFKLSAGSYYETDFNTVQKTKVY